ncbi:MAG: hypothetical protein KDC53_22540 [Saprospiraceae bacterium]|nr:hypothetical protein [Saprospiraceae bacterium]
MIEKRYSTSNAITGVLFLVATIFLLFWLAKSIFTILAFLAPALLIAAVIIDYHSVVNYGKWLFNQLRFNTLNGILYTILTVVGFPAVSLFLFGKSLFRRKMKALEKSYVEQREGVYTDYEIVDDNVTPLELPPLEKRNPAAKDDYEQLFD